jgi:sulfur carrier protein ThiS
LDTLPYTTLFRSIEMGRLGSGDAVEVEPSTTIEALLRSHGTPEAVRALVLCLVNGRVERTSYVLAAGDRLKLFLPKAGG